MKIDIITIFPELFEPFLKESIIAKAIEKGILEIKVHNLRKWTEDKHKTVDDKPFGGGRGMVIKVEPIFKAVSQLLKERKVPLDKKKIILFTPRGRKLDQSLAYELSQFENLILICGRYEGIDERVAKYISDLNLSIGDYVLMGGELPAMVLIETVSRLIPGVIGKSEELLGRLEKGKLKSKEKFYFTEYPQYTRPAVFYPAKVDPESPLLNKVPKSWKVPKVLLSGNHQVIENWRKRHQKKIG